MSLTSDDLVRVRVKCEECGGVGIGGASAYRVCGVCLRAYHQAEASASTPLACVHDKAELFDPGDACKCCDASGWIEQWVSIAALLRLVPQPAQPARKPRRRSRTNQRKVR